MAISIDWKRTVDHNHLKVSTFARRAVAFAQKPEGAKVLHIDYRKLVADPLTLSRDIHQNFGLPFPDAHADQIGQFVSENRQHKHGRNHYSMAQFELDRDELAANFGPYRERFLGLSPSDGVAGAKVPAQS